MAGHANPRKHPPSPNGAPTLTPLGHYAGRPDIALSRQVTVVGSKPGSRLHLSSSTVSQSHALIVNSAGGAYVRDLASRTHVYVNGKDHREHDLRDGDLLQVGKFKFQFNAGLPGIGIAGGHDGTQVAGTALLNVEGGEMPLPVEGRTVLIGRRPTCDIPLIEDAVSTTHAVIFELNGRRFIRDLGSRTGTFVNGQRVKDQAELKFGDQVRVGETSIEYVSADGQVADRTGDADEMDHLVSTAPLGTAALAAPRLEDSAHGTAHADDAIPMVDASRHGESFAAFVDEAPPEPDQVHLDSDPDVGVGRPGDTAVLPAQPPEKPRKVPTLKVPPPPVDEVVEDLDVPGMPGLEELERAVAAAAGPPTPVSPADAAAVDDVLGLTPEARTRESAKAEDLGGSRRGWRGMTPDGNALPVAERSAPREPQRQQPAPAPEEALPHEALPVEDVNASIEPFAADVAPPDVELADLESVEEVAAAHVPPAPPRRPAVDAFEMEVEEPSQLSAEESDEPAPALHLPSVVDDTPEFDEAMVLPLTPEEGGPIDLTVEEPPAPIDAPAPALELRAPEPEPAAEAPAPEVEPVADVPLPDPVPEPEPEPAVKPKRKRAPRKKKGAEAVEAAPVVAPEPKLEPEPEPVADAPAPDLVPEPEPEPEPVPEPVADAPRDTVEVVDETQPTPESALSEDDVADMLAESLPADDTTDAVVAADMSDTGFGRALDSFAGEASGPLVEGSDEPTAAAGGAARVESREEEPVAARASDAESAALDELVAGALGDDDDEAAVAAAPRFDTAPDETPLEDLNFAVEDEAVEPLVMDDAPPANEPLVAPRSESPLPPPPAFTVDEAHAHGPGTLADEFEPVDDFATDAHAPAAAERESEPEPVARRDAPPPEQPVPPPAAAPSGPTRVSAPGMWGPNQEHFLGGMPLKLNNPVRPGPATTGPSTAGAAAARQNGPMIPPPPPRATRPNARTRSPFDVGPSDVAAEDRGASIPPFSGKSPKAGQITTGFDGLAMPPVRQTDVFSQMATPASFSGGFGGPADDDEDIFSRGARLARQQQQQPQPAAAQAKQQQPQPQQPSQPPSEASAPKAAPAPVPAAAPHPPDVVDDTDPDGALPDDDDFAAPGEPAWAESPAEPDAADEQHAVAGGRRNRPLPTPPAFPESEPAPRKRKRRWFGLRFLLVLMLLVGLGAAGGVYGFVKKQTHVVGHLRFDGVASLKTIEQNNLLNEQKKRVADHTLRDAARRELEKAHPMLAPGFLADPIAYENVARNADWAQPPQKGAFAIAYAGRDEQGDRHRVAAVVRALYAANTSHLGTSGTARQSVAALTAAHAKSEQRVGGLKAQIEQLNVVALKMPERKRVDELSAGVARLDGEYNAAARRVRDINLDLERMRQAMPKTPQPAGTAEAPVVDPDLAAMQEELKATNEKLAQAKAARAKAAEAAQGALDAALQSFQEQIAGAQGLANGNPELSAYVAAAQALQTETRDLTDKLIRRQQEQQRRLTELKTSLAEKVEARRADAWKKDPALQKYGDELAIVQRQYGAATGGGATKEAEDYKAQINLLEQMIKARQALVGDDQFYADTINQMQKLIDDQQRGLDADRKHTEAQLERMQVAFTKAQPAVEKMPAAQKELAASLEKQLADINAARKTYTTAADAVGGGGEAGGDEEMKQAQAAAAALTGKIEARRKELATAAEKAVTAEQEQGRLVVLRSREAELAAAQTAEGSTRQAFEAAQKSLRELQAVEAEARAAGEQRDAMNTERVAAQKELEAQLRQLDLQRAEAARTVEPLVPTDTDVEMKVHDPRPTYALASVGATVAVFTLLILFTSTGAAAEPDEVESDPPMAAPAPVIDRTPPTPMPQATGSNVNGTPDSQPHVAA